jgi:hypothetical protein
LRNEEEIGNEIVGQRLRHRRRGCAMESGGV